MSSAGSATVRLEVPADAAYLAVVRAVVGNLAARNDFTLDVVDDLRIAVDEACVLLLGRATGLLTAEFEVAPPRLTISVGATVSGGWSIDRDSFGWTVLTAMVDDVEARVDGDRVCLVVSATAGAAAESGRAGTVDTDGDA